MGDHDSFFVLWAVCCLLYIVGGIRRHWRFKQLEQWAALHAPLTGAAAASSRLDGALRDVEEGFHVCAVCDFENLKRRIFCLLCGTPVAASAGPPLLQEASSPPPRMLHMTKRQRRARMRKWWQRRLDDDGNLRWERRNRPSASCVDQLPAYTLQFVVTEEAREEADAPLVVLADEGQPTEPAEPTSEAPSSDDTDDSQGQQSPQEKLMLTSIRVVNATIVEQLASYDDVSTSTLRQAENKAFISDSRLPFPSKLVQFIAHTTAVQLPPEPERANASSILLRVERDHLLEDSIQTLAGLPSETVRFGFRIAFRGETGVDAGGVYREWLLLLNEAIVAPAAGIFTCVDSNDQVFYLNPHSREVLGEHHLAHFLAAGRLIGRALLEGNVTGFHLALPLLKIILGQPVTVADLEHFDAEAFRGLEWMLDTEGVGTMELDFTITERLPSGGTRVIELVPGGTNIPLSDSNKVEYIQRKLQYSLFESVSDHLFAFLKGLHEVVPAHLLMLFDAEELDFMLSGSDEIDVDDWEKNTKYTADLIDHPAREWFWQLVREMPNEHRRRLLQFSTGAPRVPLAGFSALTSYDGRLCPFTLKGIPLQQEQYIRSHACFNRLDLPRYDAKSQLTIMLSVITADDTNVHGFAIV